MPYKPKVPTLTSKTDNMPITNINLDLIVILLNIESPPELSHEKLSFQNVCEIFMRFL